MLLLEHFSVVSHFIYTRLDQVARATCGKTCSDVANNFQVFNEGFGGPTKREAGVKKWKGFIPLSCALLA